MLPGIEQFTRTTMTSDTASLIFAEIPFGVAQLIFFEDVAMNKLKRIRWRRENGDYWEDGKSDGNRLPVAAMNNIDMGCEEADWRDVFVGFAFLRN